MEFIYNIIEVILPFDFMKYDFMKNALLAVLIITPLFGMLGTMVVNNKMAFFSDALGHSTITGVALGTLFGIREPVFAMLGFAIIFALFLSYVKSKEKLSNDTIISIFSSISLAAGLVILSRGGGFTKYTGFLVGDILSVTTTEIGMLFAVFIIVFVVWGYIYNKLLIVSINPSIARSKNINVKMIENIFLTLVALVVTVSIKWVGVLIINSLLIIPCAAARGIAKNSKSYLKASIAVSMLSGVLGLILSYYLNTSAGATMSIVAGIIFFAVTFVRS